MADMKIGQAAGAYAKAGQMDVSALGSGDSAGKAGFGDYLGDAIKGAMSEMHHNENVAQQAVLGKQGITDLVSAINSTEMTLQTVVAVRDKVINAYQDIIKMPI